MSVLRRFLRVEDLLGVVWLVMRFVTALASTLVGAWIMWPLWGWLTA